MRMSDASECDTVDSPREASKYYIKRPSEPLIRHTSMTKPKAGQVQVAWGATPRQEQYGYRSVMFVTLVSGGQWSREANKMQTWGNGDLPEGTFDSIEEATEAVEKAGISTDYAIYA